MNHVCMRNCSEMQQLLPHVLCVSVRHGVTGCCVARGGEGGAPGPRCRPEVGIRCFLSARTPGAPEPVQETGESEDLLHPHQTEGENKVIHSCFSDGRLTLLCADVSAVHGSVLPGGGGLGAGAAPGSQDRAQGCVANAEESRSGGGRQHGGGEVTGEAQRAVCQPAAAPRRRQQPAEALCR